MHTQNIDFKRRWEDIREWLGTPRVVARAANLRMVAISQEEPSWPIVIVTEKKGMDSLCHVRWTESRRTMVDIDDRRAVSHAWLALLERERAEAGDA